MKVAVIGAGSTYMPELVEGLLSRHVELPITTLALHDIDPQRLDVLAGMVRRMVSFAGGTIKVNATLDLVEAVESATFVLIQLRVGQQGARLIDETLPRRLGLLGQETTGAGGFGKALRTIPVIRGIAEQVRRHSPKAWILNFTNPVGIVTRALLDDGHHVVGLCNVGITLQRTFARILSVEPSEVILDHAGLNHLTWIRSVQVRGKERIEELVGHPHREQVAVETGHKPEIFDLLGAIPSSYLRYFYASRETQDELSSGTRALQVQKIERQLLEMYSDPCISQKPELLDERGGANYSEAASSLMVSLYSGDRAIHYVNVPNNGAVAGLDRNAVVEVPAKVDQDGPHAMHVRELAPELLALVQGVSAYEVLTLEAARTGDPRTAARALMAHPLVREPDAASAYVSMLLEADRVHLPQFTSRFL